jgi:hypothetical protein
MSFLIVVIEKCRAGNEPNQLENSSRLDSIINSLNLVHEPNESNLSWKLSSLNKWVELELNMVPLVWFMNQLEKNVGWVKLRHYCRIRKYVTYMFWFTWMAKNKVFNSQCIQYYPAYIHRSLSQCIATQLLVAQHIM